MRLVTHAYDSRESKAFSCVCLSVCLSAFMCVSPHDNSKTNMTSKCSHMMHEMTLGYPASDIILGSKGQRCEGHRVIMCKKGDRVAGVSYALYRVLSLYLFCVSYVYSLVFTTSAVSCLDGSEISCIVSEMTYNVSMGTLNPTVWYTIPCLEMTCYVR